MYAATRRWLKRNRTNFAIGFGVIGAGYIVGQYAIGKFWEMRARIKNEQIAKENLRRRFVQNQEDCTFTVLALLPTATDNIIEALPVESITHELQKQKADRQGRSAGISDITPSELSSTSPSASGGGDDGRSVGSESFMHTSQMATSTPSASGVGDGMRSRKSKAQLWNELKISSITRAFTMIYTLALLTIFTRIQLNLLGRRSYVSSVVLQAVPRRNDSTISLENHENGRSAESDGPDFETNRNFLAFSWWLLQKGWRDMMTKVESAVKDVFGPLNPREEITFPRLSELIIETRKKIEGETEKQRKSQRWLPYLLPPTGREMYVLRESGVMPRDTTSSQNTDSPTSPSDPGISIQDSGPIDDSVTPATIDPYSQQASDAPEPLQPVPPTQFQETVPPALRRLLDETADIIDSPAATRTTTLLLDALFSHLTDNAIKIQAFKSPPPLQELPPSTEAFPNLADILEPRSKLATILATLTRQAHAMASAALPNAYITSMEALHELEALSAVVYSSNFGVEEAIRGAGATKLTADTEAEEDPLAGTSASRPVSILSTSSAGTGGEGFVGASWGLLEGAWGAVVGGARSMRGAIASARP